MKKTFVVFLTLVVLTTAMVSCNESGKTAEDCSSQVISLMSEMIASEQYAKFYNLTESQKETRKKLNSGSYLEPTAIYELTIPDEAIIGENIDIEDEYKELDQYVRSMNPSVASLINCVSGTDAMVLSSAFGAHKTFVCEQIKETTVYLYTYREGCPIVITIIPGESGSVSVSGCFIINDDFDTGDAAQIEKSCEAAGVRGVTAKKK